MTLGGNIPWTEVRPGEPASVSARGLNALAAAVRRMMPIVADLEAAAPESQLPGAWLKVITAAPTADALYVAQKTTRDAGATTRAWTDPTYSASNVNEVWLEFSDEESTYTGTPKRQHAVVRAGQRVWAALSGSFTAGSVTRELWTAQALVLGYFIAAVDAVGAVASGKYPYTITEQTKSTAGATWGARASPRTGTAYNLAEQDATADEPATPVPVGKLVRVTELLLANGTVEYWIESSPGSGVAVQQDDEAGDIVANARVVRIAGAGGIEITVEELNPGEATVTVDGTGAGAGAGAGDGGAYRVYTLQRNYAAGSTVAAIYDISNADVRGKMIDFREIAFAINPAEVDDSHWFAPMGFIGLTDPTLTVGGSPSLYVSSMHCDPAGSANYGAAGGWFFAVNCFSDGGAAIYVRSSDGHLILDVQAHANPAHSVSGRIVWRLCN